MQPCTSLQRAVPLCTLPTPKQACITYTCRISPSQASSHNCPHTSHTTVDVFPQPQTFTSFKGFMFFYLCECVRVPTCVYVPRCPTRRWPPRPAHPSSELHISTQPCTLNTLSPFPYPHPLPHPQSYMFPWTTHMPENTCTPLNPPILHTLATPAHSCTAFLPTYPCRPSEEPKL